MANWTIRFMALAKEVSSWSKDPTCKVGTVIISRDRRNVTFGYNGLPSGIEGSITDKQLVCHSEINAILNARRDLSGWTLYCTKPPCIDCAKAIIQAGIVRVVCPPVDQNSKWWTSTVKAVMLLEKANISVKIP